MFAFAVGFDYATFVATGWRYAVRGFARSDEGFNGVTVVFQRLFYAYSMWVCHTIYSPGYCYVSTVLLEARFL